MSEEHKPEILGVETILDSCVLAEGKRWYQVKWKPSWLPEERLPSGTLEVFKKEKVVHDENDGLYRISEERTGENGIMEYMLCRGNTWESEEKLNSIDKNIVYSYWSQQEDLKEIVKIEEDFGDYGIKHGAPEGVAETIHDDSSQSDSDNRISMVMNNSDHGPLPYIKTEVEDEESIQDNAVPVENATHEATTEAENTDDYQCAKCNSMFISGKMSGKDFLANREKTKEYKQCMRCGEMFCLRCSQNMGELRHNGKTSLFCDRCIENFATQSVPENNKTISTNKTSNVTQVVGTQRPIFSGFPGGNYDPKNFCCEICGKSINSSSHEIIVTGENSFQCSECFKKTGQSQQLPTQQIVPNNRFPYFMPVVFPPAIIDDGSKQLNGFKKPGVKHVTKKGIKVLSGNHKSHVVHKDTKGNDNEKQLPNVDKSAPHSSAEGAMNSYDDEDIDVHQDDEALDGKDSSQSGNYKCFDCGRSFNRQYTLDTHQRIHTGEKPYVCEICGARFRQSGTKLNHVRAVHRKERPFQCQYCGKTFSHKSSITVHIRIHTKEKPYQCKTCERCFTDRATYLKHQSIHSGVKPYHCPMCTRKFSQKSNLKRHYKNIHELDKQDNVADLSSGSGEGGMLPDATDRTDASAISAAISKITSLPEYPTARQEHTPASEETVVFLPQTIKVEPECTYEINPEAPIDVIPNTTVTPSTAMEITPVCSV